MTERPGQDRTTDDGDQTALRNRKPSRGLWRIQTYDDVFVVLALIEDVSVAV